MQRKVLKKLKLNVDLGFKIVKDIKSNRGNPQGMKTSAYAFSTILQYVMEKVQELVPHIDWILQSDDLSCICDSVEEYQDVMKILKEELEKVGMMIDHGKTQFMCFGDFPKLFVKKLDKNCNFIKIKINN